MTIVKSSFHGIVYVSFQTVPNVTCFSEVASLPILNSFFVFHFIIIVMVFLCRQFRSFAAVNFVDSKWCYHWCCFWYWFTLLHYFSQLFISLFLLFSYWPFTDLWYAFIAVPFFYLLNDFVFTVWYFVMWFMFYCSLENKYCVAAVSYKFWCYFFSCSYFLSATLWHNVSAFVISKYFMLMDCWFVVWFFSCHYLKKMDVVADKLCFRWYISYLLLIFFYVWLFVMWFR